MSDTEHPETTEAPRKRKARQRSLAGLAQSIPKIGQ